jgi:hypothetical protein
MAAQTRKTRPRRRHLPGQLAKCGCRTRRSSTVNSVTSIPDSAAGQDTCREDGRQCLRHTGTDRAAAGHRYSLGYSDPAMVTLIACAGTPRLRTRFTTCACRVGRATSTRGMAQSIFALNAARPWSSRATTSLHRGGMTSRGGPLWPPCWKPDCATRGLRRAAAVGTQSSALEPARKCASDVGWLTGRASTLLSCWRRVIHTAWSTPQTKALRVSLASSAADLAIAGVPYRFCAL